MSRAVSSRAAFLPSAGGEVCRHDLAVGLRFVDPFTDAAPPVPPLRRRAVEDRFIVRIEALDWTARYSSTDGTYRFAVANASRDIPWQAAAIFGTASAQFPTIPATLNVNVAALDSSSARYFVPSPIELSLPVPGGPFNTPQQQIDAYVREFAAYPTRMFRAYAGETAVRGVVRDNAGAPRPGVEVAVYETALQPTEAIFTRTDANGFFAYRLPWLKRPMTPVALPSLGVAVRLLDGTQLTTIEVGPHVAGDASRAALVYGSTASISVRAF